MIYPPRSRTILRHSVGYNDNSLVGWWTFDGGQANDISGNNNHGTLVSSLGYSDAIVPGFDNSGGSLNFNGTTSYVNLGNPASLSLTTDVTFSVWVYWTTSDAGAHDIVQKDDTATTPGYAFGIYQNKIYTFISPTLAQSSGAVSSNIWVHIAAVKAGTVVSFYINGAASGTGSAPSSIPTNALNANIGRKEVGGIDYFPGKLDDLRVYNRALTGGEINSIYNSAFTPWMEGTLPVLMGGFFSRYYYDMLAGSRMGAA